MFRQAAITLLLAATLTAANNPRQDFALGVLAETRGDPATASQLFEKPA